MHVVLPMKNDSRPFRSETFSLLIDSQSHLHRPLTAGSLLAVLSPRIYFTPQRYSSSMICTAVLPVLSLW